MPLWIFKTKIENIPKCKCIQYQWYLKIGLSLAADLALFAYGSCYTMSSVVLPQIEDGSNTSDMKITSEEGSWFGNDMASHYYSYCLYLYKNSCAHKKLSITNLFSSEYFCNWLDYWRLGGRNIWRKTWAEICFDDRQPYHDCR